MRFTSISPTDEFPTILQVSAVFDKLIEYMPMPPEDDSSGEQQHMADLKLNFSFVECLMFTFHGLGKFSQSMITSEILPYCSEFSREKRVKKKDHGFHINTMA